ncbi:flagellar hook-basal body complex protein FliE [Candidatus Bathyarchaeota archaeon]|nr:flagellar hook-basal body complex protein FliE [Candidatus Bathyarchaeota archaeon]
MVVGVAGMPGAGKATVKEIVQKMGYSVVVMGDEIREETKRRKLKPTPENIGMVMLKLREEEGPYVVAKRCIPKIEKAKGRVVIVDGIRSPHEVEEFKKHFPNFTLIAIHASPETRFKRLFQRKRSDDPKGWETFMERDLRELSVGLGNVIASADYLIVNEGTKAQLKRKIREFLERVIQDG